jgi:hypothetical protein
VPGHIHPEFGEGICEFLETDTVFGRHWVCGLRRRLGSWDAVHADSGYIENVHAVWELTGTADCGDFTGTGRPQCCYADEYPVVFGGGDD